MATVGPGLGQARGGEPTGWRTPLDRAVAERGRMALLLEGFLEARVVRRGLSQCRSALGRDRSRSGKRPGRLCGRIPAPLWSAPGPLPQRRAADGPAPGLGPKGVKTGLQIDCMLCHGGLDRRPELRRAGQHPARLEGGALRAERSPTASAPPLSTFVLNSSRGTNNAGQVAAALLSMRNRNLSVRSFPLPLAANLPEMDTPAVVAPEAQAHHVLRRPHRRPLGPNQHAVPAGREEPRRPARRSSRRFATSRPFCGASSRPGIRSRSTRARPGAGRWSSKRTAPAATERMGRMESIPTRSSRSSRSAPTRRGRWVFPTGWWRTTTRPGSGAEHPVETKRVGYQAPPLDGIWAIGTLPAQRLGSDLARLCSTRRARPSRFTRPPSTDFAHYDTGGTSAGSSAR